MIFQYHELHTRADHKYPGQNLLQENERIYKLIEVISFKVRPSRLYAAIPTIVTLFNACLVGLFGNGLQLPCRIYLYLRDVLKSFPLQGDLQPGEEEEVAGGPNLVSKVGEEPWGCCTWPRISWHSEPRGMAHCRGAEDQYNFTTMLLYIII
jgi:hypothetical protein